MTAFIYFYTFDSHLNENKKKKKKQKKKTKKKKNEKNEYYGTHISSENILDIC